MKIIEPSAHIEELPENIYQRIDKAASVCYQRPAKPTVEEAMEFCQKMIDSEHGMALEFATVHLVCPAYYVPVSRYVKYEMMVNEECTAESYTGQPMYVVTGSIRALMEADNSFGVLAFFAGEFPLFFAIPEGASSDLDSMEGIRFAHPHEIPWQHEHLAVRVVCSRAISHQLVRHRPCAILQESQRYCRYDGERFDGEVTFIRPQWTDRGDWMRKKFESDCAVSEERYFDRLRHKLSPQEARGALINDAKTELLMYANLPEWQHILDEETMRCSSQADPEMQRIMKPLREEFKARWPEVF